MLSIHPNENPSGRGSLVAPPGSAANIIPGLAGAWRRPWYSYTTQRIANNLPYHLAIRTQKTSNGQELLNVFGVQAELVDRQIRGLVDSRFLSTVPLNHPGTLLRADLPQNLVDADTDRTTNLVRNSSFEINTNELRLPDFWRADNAIAQVEQDGVIGSKSLRILPDGGTAWVYQDLELTTNPGEALTYSCWYKTSQTGAPTASTFAMVVRVLDGSGTWHESATVLNASVSDWTRVIGTFTVPANSVEMQVGFRQSTTFTNPLYVDCLQLQQGSNATPWEPYLWDAPMWFAPTVLRPPIFVEGGNRQLMTVDEVNFWHVPPTRASYVGSRSLSRPSSPATAGYTREIDADGMTFRAEWQPNGTKVRKIGDAAQAADVYGDFDLALPSYRGELLDVAITEVEAITQFNYALWIVIRAENHLGVTNRYLVVAQLGYPRPTPTYLECSVCIELPSQIPAVSSAWFQTNKDPHYLILDDGTTEYGVRLHYDTAFYSRQDASVYFREPCDDVQFMVAQSVPSLRYSAKIPSIERPTKGTS